MIRALLLIVVLLLPTPAIAGDETCQPTPATIWHPAGVEGCTLDGRTDGVASTYPGVTAAANWCSWTLRHSVGCGVWTVQSHVTGVTITVTPGEFCQCFWMTDRRLIDLTPQQVRQLGLDPSDGLFEVTVAPAPDWALAPAVQVLPDTAAGS